MSISLAAGLDAGLDALSLDLKPAQRQSLLDYLALLQKWNQVYNLTAVRDPQAMLSHHLLDCLAVVAPLRAQLTSLTQPGPVRLLDVGSGAGLPGLVLAICMPDLQVNCVDTVAKKSSFIQQAALSLGLPNLRGVHARGVDVQEEAILAALVRAVAAHTAHRPTVLDAGTAGLQRVTRALPRHEGLWWFPTQCAHRRGRKAK